MLTWKGEGDEERKPGGGGGQETGLSVGKRLEFTV